MSGYRLIDVGYPYKKIMHGRKWVGRTIKCADGRWLARINNSRGPATEVYGSSEVEVFEEAVARQFGYNNAGELHSHNAKVRAVNKVKKQRAQILAHRFMTGTFNDKLDVIDSILGISSEDK